LGLSCTRRAPRALCVHVSVHASHAAMCTTAPTAMCALRCIYLYIGLANEDTNSSANTHPLATAPVGAHCLSLIGIVIMLRLPTCAQLPFLLFMLHALATKCVALASVDCALPVGLSNTLLHSTRSVTAHRKDMVVVLSVLTQTPLPSFLSSSCDPRRSVPWLHWRASVPVLRVPPPLSVCGE
jgi:hypothetical protein